MIWRIWGAHAPSRAVFSAFAEHPRTRHDAVLLAQRAAGEGASGSTRGACAPQTTNARCYFNCFLLQRGFAITKRRAFEKIVPQKPENSAEPLILRGVHQLVDDEVSILAAIASDEDAVLQSEPARGRRQQFDLLGSGF